MKKLIILVVALLVIAGITMGLLWFLNIGPFEIPEEVQQEQVEEPAAADDDDDDEPEPPRYMDLEQLVIPIFRGDKIVGSIQLQLKLVINPEAEDELMHLRPRISNAFLMDLYGYLPRVIEKQETLDLGVLKRRLMLIAVRTVGEGKIEKVLIQSIMDNPKL